MSTTLMQTLLPGLPDVVRRGFAKLTQMDGLEELYAAARDSEDQMVAAVLDRLSVRLHLADKDTERIPRSGPVIALSNHPTGMFDGLVAAAVLLRIRTDVKILANDMLSAIPELADLLIPVDLSDTRRAVRTNAARIKEAIDHLSRGGLLLVFPAGAVSTFQWRTRQISDPAWKPAIARLIRAAARAIPRLALLPMHVTGGNTAAFHLAGTLHAKLRTAMLVRELLNKRGAEIEVRAGNPIQASKLPQFRDDAECASYLRWRTYLLANRAVFRAQTNLPLSACQRDRAPEPVIGSTCPDAMSREVAALPAHCKLGESDGLSVYLASAAEIPNVMIEVARLRESTFRAAGEGTGRACDRDRFDDHYQHLFLWNSTKREVAGAYRLARTAAVRESHGLSGLYTATLFSYGESFLDRMGPAIELGRSFVRQEYQRGFAPLLLLWKGIGQVVARHPECRILFGPVSISSQYQAISRELMVAFLERRAPLTEWIGLVASKTPFRANRPTPEFAHSWLELEDLSSAIADIEPDGRGVPVLLRQYLKLGGRLLGFNVDPEFSNALDGLIVVDLMRTERKLLERYLGKSEAAVLLDFQKEAYAA